jgi:hypothetical protein
VHVRLRRAARAVARGRTLRVTLTIRGATPAGAQVRATVRLRVRR